MKEKKYAINSKDTDDKLGDVEKPVFGKKETKNPKMCVIIALLVGLVISVGVFIFTNVQKSNYEKKLKEAHMLMLDGGSKAEKITDLTSKVWYNSIYEQSSPETDKYCAYKFTDSVYANIFYHGFDESISNMYKDEEIKVTIEEIKSNQEQVATTIKELQNPPLKYKECYNTLLDMYESYNILTDLAVSPKGNYNDYSDNKNTAINKLVYYSKKLDVQSP